MTLNFASASFRSSPSSSRICTRLVWSRFKVSSSSATVSNFSISQSVWFGVTSFDFHAASPAAVLCHFARLNCKCSSISFTFPSFCSNAEYPLLAILNSTSSYCPWTVCCFVSSSAFACSCRPISSWLSLILSSSSCSFASSRKISSRSIWYWSFSTSFTWVWYTAYLSRISSKCRISFNVSSILLRILPYCITLSCRSSIWISCSIQIYSFTKSSSLIFILNGIARLNSRGNFSISSPPK